MRERSTMRAASASNQKLNSASAEALPGTLHVAAHEDQALDLGFDRRFHAQRQRQVGHRPDFENGQLAGVPLDFRNEVIRRRSRDAGGAR